MSRTRNQDDADMKPELDDEAAPKKTGLLPVYNARLVGMLLVLGFVNILLIAPAARMAYFPTDSANRSRIAIPGVLA